VAGLTRGLLEAGAGNLDEEAIAGRLVDIGARLGGGVDSDRASVSLRTLVSKTEREAALELMRTVLSAPTFPQSVLEREKARTIAGIREAETRPDAIAGKRLPPRSIPITPMALQPDGGDSGRRSRARTWSTFIAGITARRAPWFPSSAMCRAPRPRRSPSA
jgi:zinc protease